jgi:polysaccharide biosynthesis protein PslG
MIRPGYMVRARRALVIAGAVVILTSNCIVASQPTSGAIPSRLVGVNTVTAREDQFRVKDFDALTRDGFRAVRLHVEWPIIEPAPGQFDWSSTDAQIDAAHQRGLDVLGVITYTPSWAVAPEGRGYIHPGPADPATFAAFVQIAAERYKDRIDSWEIWNEPNVVQSFAPAPDRAKYAAMLKAAYTEIKAISPNATVISGGTSPAVDSPTSVAPAMFIRGLFEAGAGDYFDAVAMHPYSAPNMLSESGGPESSHAAIQDVIALLQENGQGYKSIWFTEFGASTATGVRSPDGGQLGISEQEQAAYLEDGINYVRSLPNSGPIFIFDYRDIETRSSTVEFSYGLVRDDFSPKPSLAVVQSLLNSS